jgi:hypothetical protein
MLRLSAEQYDWVLSEQRQRLARSLTALLAQLWPALAQKLGDRAEVFMDAALQQASRYGLVEPAHVARYANLWCVWGPAFDDKPGFEWAMEILHDDRRSPAIKAQQLVMHSRDVLVQRAAPGLTPEQFDAADAAMEAAVAKPGAQPWIEGTAGVLAQPRQACDLTAFDVALGDQGWRQEYRLAWSGQGALISLAPVSVVPQRFRTDTPLLPGVEATPRQIAVMAQLPEHGHKAWLHVRCAIDAVCDDHVHPRVELKSDAGMQVFMGAAARLIKTPLHCAKPFVPPKPPGSGAAPKASVAQAKPGAPINVLVDEGALCKEPAPRYLNISAQTCGLRRTGAPLGNQEAVLSIYPADQWLAEFKTSPQPLWSWPVQGARDVTAAPIVRLERDGRPLPVQSWQHALASLPEALANGIDGWFNELNRSEVLLSPRIEITPNLMHGSSVWTWGAREQVGPEGSTGFLRAQAFVRLVACASELAVMGELRIAGAHARVHALSKGQTLFHGDLLRETPDAELPALLSTLKATWRHPMVVEVDALSSPELAVLSEAAGSQCGALVGEAGLRPRPDAQGWQWYVQLKLEPCVLALQIDDPMLGQQLLKRTLWPATTLLDWSAG